MQECVAIVQLAVTETIHILTAIVMHLQALADSYTLHNRASQC